METWKLWGIIIEPSGNQPQWGDSRDILGSLWPHYPGVKTKWATHGHPKWKSPRHGRYMYTYIYINIWSVVWNMFYFFIYWEFHHPNWRSPSFFRGVGQPPTRYAWLVFALQKLGTQAKEQIDVQAHRGLNVVLLTQAHGHFCQSQLGSWILGVCFKLFSKRWYIFQLRNTEWIGSWNPCWVTASNLKYSVPNVEKLKKKRKHVV